MGIRCIFLDVTARRAMVIAISSVPF